MDYTEKLAIVNRRTPGEWTAANGVVLGDGMVLADCSHRVRRHGDETGEQNAAAICTAVNHFAGAVARIAELERRLAVIEAECERRGNERLAALGRLSEMEKRLYKEVDAAWCDGKKMAGRRDGS